MYVVVDQLFFNDGMTILHSSRFILRGKRDTLWLTNMELENGHCEDYFCLQTGGCPFPC